MSRADFEKETTQVMRKIQKACARRELPICFLAVATVMQTLFEQLPNGARNQSMIHLINMNLGLPVFSNIRPDSSGHDLNALAAITDNDLLTVAILGKVRALVELCMKHWRENREKIDVAHVRQQYKVDNAVHPAAVSKLGQKFNAEDLKGMLAIFTAVTSDMLSSIPNDDERNRFSLSAMKAILPPSDLADKAATLDLNVGVQLMLEMSDEQSRNMAAVEIIKLILTVWDRDIDQLQSVVGEDQR